jgi:hypothetical protein
MNMNIHKVSKIEVAKTRNMHEGDEDITPSYIRTIAITSHAWGDVDNKKTFELVLYGSDDVKNLEEALQIKL